MLKAIYIREKSGDGQEQAAAVIKKLRRQRLQRAAQLVEESIDETLTSCAFPGSHWIEIHTNQPAGAAHAGDPTSNTRGHL